jgi:O-antigen/teichoic acid export membrane protein
VSGSPPLRSLVLRGLGWKFVSQIFLQSSRVIVAVVLARLLAPDEYGLAAMVLVVGTLVLVFSDLALGASLVQRPSLSEADRSTVFWTSLGAGVAFTIVGVALSGPIAAFYGEPRVQPLLVALSLSFVVTSLGTTQSALLMRTMDFRRLELRMMAGTFAGAVVGVAAAVQGAGAWAIIAQQLTIAGVSSTMLWLVSPWRPRFTFSLASLRDLGGFSANVFGQRVLYYLHANADKVLIGRFLGSSALGVYGLAYNVVTVPFSRIAVPLAEVLLPAFSKMQEDRARMAAAWLRATRLVGAVTIPALLGLIAVAPDFVAVVLGERWDEATPVIQILAGVGLIQSLQTLNSNILQALDRTHTLLRYSIVFFAAHFLAFVIGLNWGVVGVAACYAVSTAFVEPLYAWLTARALGCSVMTVARNLSGVAVAAVAMLATLVLSRAFLIDAGLGAGLRLALLVPLGAAIYALFSVWTAHEVITEIRTLGRRGARETPAAQAQPLEPESEPVSG